MDEFAEAFGRNVADDARLLFAVMKSNQCRHLPNFESPGESGLAVDVDVAYRTLFRKLPDRRFDDSAWPTPSGVEEEHFVVRLPLGAA